MPDEYVPDGSFLTCDKGNISCRLKVTHSTNASVYGEKLATEADMVTGENIFSMGRCSITGRNCNPQPVYWDLTMEKIKKNGYKLLVKEAHLLCKQGGKIGIQFTNPEGQANIGISYVEWAGNTIVELANGVRKVAPNVANMLNVDEMVAITELRWSQSYGKGTFSDGRTVSGLRNTIMHNGSNTLGQIPPLEVVRMSDGKLTSFDHRRGIAAIEGGAEKVPVKIIDGRSPLPEAEAKRFEVKNSTQAKRLGVNKNDIPKTYEDAIKYRSAGQGSKFPLEGSPTPPYAKNPPLSPPSNATKFINKVGESLSDSKFSQAIRNSEAATNANKYLIKNADKIAKIGKAFGKGALVIGVAVDGYSIYSSYEEEKGFGKKTKEATGSAVGGLGGGWAGAEIGAIIGTCICPGIGTVIGGVVGGIIGGIAGSSGGKWLTGLFD